MADRLQLRKGSTSSHAAFTGAVGEVTYDTEQKILVAHDGATIGGVPTTTETSPRHHGWVDGVDATDNILSALAAGRDCIFDGTYIVSDTITLPAQSRGMFRRAVFEASAGLENKPVIVVSTGCHYDGYVMIDGNSLTGVIGLQFGNPTAGAGCQHAHIGRVQTSYCTTGTLFTADNTYGSYHNTIGRLRSDHNTDGLVQQSTGTTRNCNANVIHHASLQNNTGDAYTLNKGDGNRFGYLEAESNTGTAIKLISGQGFFVDGGWIEGNGVNINIANNPDVVGVYITASVDDLTPTTKFIHTFSANRVVEINNPQHSINYGAKKFTYVKVGANGEPGNDQDTSSLLVAGGMQCWRKTAAGYFYFEGQTVVNDALKGYSFSGYNAATPPVYQTFADLNYDRLYLPVGLTVAGTTTIAASAFFATNLPTSGTGLTAGRIYRDGVGPDSVLKIK